MNIEIERVRNGFIIAVIPATDERKVYVIQGGKCDLGLFLQTRVENSTFKAEA